MCERACKRNVIFSDCPMPLPTYISVYLKEPATHFQDWGVAEYI